MEDRSLVKILHQVGQSLTTLPLQQSEEAILEEIARSAAGFLKTDVLTLYRYKDEQSGFEIPPIVKGEIYHPEFMHTQVYPDDAPSKIVKFGTQYWPYAATEPFLSGDVPPRDGLPARPRFVTRERIVSSAGIHLKVGNKTVGVMFFNFRVPHAFDPEERWTIETFANYAAIALENLTLYRKIQESTVQEERERLRHELHDAIGGPLHGMVMLQAEALRDLLLEEKYEEVDIGLQRLHAAASFAYDELSYILEDLYEPILEKDGLIAALENYVQMMRERTGFDIYFSAAGQKRRLPLRVEHVLYRIGQEALTNAVKHANLDSTINGRIDVKLGLQQHGVMLTVADNGIGFDAGMELSSASFGLRSMKRRAEKIGAYFEIRSQPGEGTVVSVTATTKETGDGRENQSSARR